MKRDINKIIYCAGYLDGDGCFYIGTTIQRRNVVVYESSIQVVSVKIESLEFFKELFGGSIREKPIRLNHRQAYCWTIKGKASLLVAQQVLSFLRDKKNQCSFFIQYVQLINPNYCTKVAEAIITLRDELITNVREDKHMIDLVTEEKINSLKDVDTIAPESIDYPYLAGLIDSEGCFRIKKWKPKNKPNYVYAISLEIGNTRFPIFEYLKTRFGGSIVFIPPKNRKRASATWAISSFALSKLIPDLLPWLLIKKEAAEKVMEFYATTLSNGGDRHSQEFKELYQENLIRRESIVDHIHKLNLKGLKS